ncbi:MAG: WD40 repeat domain-containing protein [Pseudonocardiales bacterium]
MDVGCATRGQHRRLAAPAHRHPRTRRHASRSRRPRRPSHDRHTARVWDTDSGSELVVLRGHDHGVRGVAWASDSRRLVTGSGDQTVRIWDATISIEDLVANAHRRVSRKLSAE